MTQFRLKSPQLKNLTLPVKSTQTLLFMVVLQRNLPLHHHDMGARLINEYYCDPKNCILSVLLKQCSLHTINSDVRGHFGQGLPSNRYFDRYFDNCDRLRSHISLTKCPCAVKTSANNISRKDAVAFKCREYIFLCKPSFLSKRLDSALINIFL